MPGVFCTPFLLTLMFFPIPTHLLNTCSPEHSLPSDKRKRRDEKRGREGLEDQVSLGALIGIQKHSFQSSCQASLRAPPGLRKVLRNGPEVLRCTLQISPVSLWQVNLCWLVFTEKHYEIYLLLLFIEVYWHCVRLCVASSLLELSSVWLQLGWKCALTAEKTFICRALNPLSYLQFKTTSYLSCIPGYLVSVDCMYCFGVHTHDSFSFASPLLLDIFQELQNCSVASHCAGVGGESSSDVASWHVRMLKYRSTKNTNCGWISFWSTAGEHFLSFHFFSFLFPPQNKVQSEYNHHCPLFLLFFLSPTSQILQCWTVLV